MQAVGFGTRGSDRHGEVRPRRPTPYGVRRTIRSRRGSPASDRDRTGTAQRIRAGLHPEQQWPEAGWRATTPARLQATRSEEHTSELQSLMRISYAVFCLKKKTNTRQQIQT